jgi:hypothetical protein
MRRNDDALMWQRGYRTMTMAAVPSNDAAP